VKGKLFYRFQRGVTKAHGKGLGLYLARTLVEGYHGKVWVEDRVSGDHTKGARFVVDEVREASRGGFYRVLGEIRKLEG
jgi:signal transduction histidine kinase